MPTDANCSLDVGDGGRIEVRPITATAENDMAIGIAAGGDDGRESIFGHREEAMGMASGADGIKRDLHTAVGAVFETDRNRQTGGQFPVDLALGGPGTDGSPTHQIADELGRDGIEEFAAGGQAEFGEIHQQAAGFAQPFVDGVGIVEMGIVDEPLPTDNGARFFEVDPHDHQQVFRQALGFRARVCCPYSRAASGSWMEQGPTTTTSRSSRPCRQSTTAERVRATMAEPPRSRGTPPSGWPAE